jgi:ethylmalonyl-CoA mutase
VGALLSTVPGWVVRWWFFRQRLSAAGFVFWSAFDGHSNGAEHIAKHATDAGIDVVYDGMRLTPAEIVEAARSGVHCVGLSTLSGSHIALTEEVLKLLRAAGLEHVPLIVGGIVPPADVGRLKAAGVAAVYTPKDFEINSILRAVVQEVEARFDAQPRDRL